MIYFALIVVCILMALITVFLSLFCYEAFRPFSTFTATGTVLFLLIFALNFVFFTYDQTNRIVNGQAGLAWYNLISMGAVCLVFLFPLIYVWRLARKDRLKK